MCVLVEVAITVLLELSFSLSVELPILDRTPSKSLAPSLAVVDTWRRSDP